MRIIRPTAMLCVSLATSGQVALAVDWPASVPAALMAISRDWVSLGLPKPIQ